jgi:hypothetical protein
MPQPCNAVKLAPIKHAQPIQAVSKRAVWPKRECDNKPLLGI